MSVRICLLLASLFGFTGVMLGAFAAHGLGETDYLQVVHRDAPAKMIAGTSVAAPYRYLQDFQTGVRYQMWHALALMMMGLRMQTAQSRLLSFATVTCVAGILLFSGSLYILVLCGPRWGNVPWGLVAPVGGTFLLVSWASLAIAVGRSAPDSGSAESH
ncbi:MAG: DUF423 domain-containing protein [Planctomycetaceae bacterium]